MGNHYILCFLCKISLAPTTGSVYIYLMSIEYEDDILDLPEDESARFGHWLKGRQAYWQSAVEFLCDTGGLKADGEELEQGEFLEAVGYYLFYSDAYVDWEEVGEVCGEVYQTYVEELEDNE